MADPFVGEVRLFGGTFAPQGWLFCAGQTLQISEYEVLFTLIGTTYGGDGQTTFILPNLQGRTPVHMGVSSTSGASYVIGQPAGAESVTLTAGQVPSHAHTVVARNVDGDMSTPSPGTGVLANVNAAAAADKIYAYAPYNAAQQTMMASGVGPPSAGGQPHDNMQPFVAVTYIIAWAGIFPSHP